MLIAQSALQIISAKAAIVLQMSNDGFHHTASSEFFFNDAKDAPFLSRMIDTVFVGVIVTTIAAVNLNPLRLDAGDADHVLSHRIEGMAIERPISNCKVLANITDKACNLNGLFQQKIPAIIKI